MGTWTARQAPEEASDPGRAACRSRRERSRWREPTPHRPPRLPSSPLPHFQLVTVDGTALGARELGGRDWPAGSVIYTRPDEPNLRVVRELDTENDDPEMHFTVLVVEAVGS